MERQGTVKEHLCFRLGEDGYKDLRAYLVFPPSLRISNVEVLAYQHVLKSPPCDSYNE